MRENRLTPFLDPRYKIDGSLEIPLERAKDQLEKHTRYWPMIISQTTIFNGLMYSFRSSPAPLNRVISCYCIHVVYAILPPAFLKILNHKQFALLLYY